VFCFEDGASRGRRRCDLDVNSEEIIPADEAIHNNSIPPERKKAMGIYIQSRYERVLTSS
jgi:hypothetical protein